MSQPSSLHTEYETYARQASEVRADILTMTHEAGSGHPGSSFSSVDLLVWLYNEVLDVDPSEPTKPDRDRLVFSKGHACPALYAVLSRLGFFDPAELSRLRQTGGLLKGHASDDIPGIEFSSGSLGQGLSFAIGTALSGRLEGREYRSFVMLGDGELQEGQVWEAVMSAAHRNLDDLVAIVEHNGIQNDGSVPETKALAPIADKFEAFGWYATECDGHDFESIEQAFTDVAMQSTGQPAVIVADTTKGKGVSFMEDDELGYHSQVLTSEELERAFRELDVEDRLDEV